jgi:hypothetical protein
MILAAIKAVSAQSPAENSSDPNQGLLPDIINVESDKQDRNHCDTCSYGRFTW